MENFFEYAEKKKHYFSCLCDILNYFDSHSESIKQNRMNNAKGHEEIIRGFMNNLDSFVSYGDDVELTVSEKKIRTEEERLKHLLYIYGGCNACLHHTTPNRCSKGGNCNGTLFSC